ncbi:hypothetical protein [Mycolicibacter icosiumassiliensis]|uniref:hypothetical protein n=1 Tax=Mycolicibacter icosiumassiliensis TaxID=1792835 RepID=UPI00082A2690|nr:hypothetical protein [Mycolicibacter icosiumassiliensis]
MYVAVCNRRQVKGGVAAAVAGIVAGQALAVAPLPGLASVERAASLLAADSLLNVPLNLFQDVVNIPSNEIQAIQNLGNAMFFGGTWFTSSATNLWGEDPGDGGRFMAITQMLFPFPAISGIDDPAPGYGDFNWDDAAAGHLGLSQQIALMLDAELPVSASSDADWSGPVIPIAPITGYAPLDSGLWNTMIWTGLQEFPLIDNWFKVPLSDLQDGYTFGNVVDPSAGVGENGAVPTDDVYQMPGTHPLLDANGNPVLNAGGNVIQLMPWSNQEFKLDLAYPFQHFWQSLQAPVDPNTYVQGFQLPDLIELGRALQNLTAGSVVGFDPFVVGSPLCLQVCGSIPDALSMPGIVQGISELWPGNTSIEHWLELYNTPGTGPGDLANPFGMTNNPVQTSVNFSNLFMEGIRAQFDLGNPLPNQAPEGVNTPTEFPVGPTAQALIDLMQKDLVPGVNDTSVQDFVGSLASAFHYTPIDYSDPNWLIDAVPPNTIEEWLASLFAGLGF